MEPWEALDVDDSDLHSLLRPCKRLHQNPKPSTSTSTSSSAAPLLTPPLVVENSDHQLQSPPQRLIPGPAGAVQAAMIQRTYDLQCHNSISSQGDNPIPTQEYIRRAVENSTDFDYDFQSNPWLCALEFVGAENGKIPCTPLSSVNKCLQSARVDQVVAVVKSCTQNGLGGLIVTLKDPTGSIGASIHHKVLSESQHGKDICIGSVLILKKVAVFCPSSSAYYLNITLGNLTKVFCKESGPPLVNSRAAYKVNYSDPESAASASARKASALQITDDETIEEILDDRTIECSAGGNFRNEIQMEKENLVPDNYICNNNSGFEKTSVEYKECLQQTQSSAIEFGAVRSRGTCNENNNQQMEECSQGTLTPRNKRESPKKNHFDPDILVTDVFKDHRQPIASKVSLPQWTDDQLDELFACEDDDE
ncbi:putative ADP-ribosylation factor GTPase-activating protein AGD13-like [Capsicum annuum]|nr:putative ADP-ribosylation factor GTPase-activating protein AGD13-like [Capsicum annuum]